MKGPDSGRDGGRVATVLLSVQGVQDELVRQDTLFKMQLFGLPAAADREAEALEESLRMAVAVLEPALFVAAFIEQTRARGYRTFRDAMNDRRELLRSAEAVSGLDLGKLVKEHAAMFLSDAPTPADDAEIPDALPAIRELVDRFPGDLLDSVLEMSPATPGPWRGLVRRCRRACAALKEILQRNDSRIEARIGVLGPKYADRELSVPEVARVLGIPARDAVALLERHGYWRAPAVASEEDKTKCIEKIRGRRSAEQVAVDPSELAEVVIASQRIEGVDARPWLTPKAK